MDEGHDEPVVLKFSHFNNFPHCSDYADLQNTIETSLGNYLYTSGSPATTPLNSMISNGGKVIVLIDDLWATSTGGGCGATPGFYVFRDWCTPDTNCSQGAPRQGQFNVYDRYSNTNSYDDMKSDQLNKLATYNGKMGNDPSVDCDLFLLSWTLTPATGTGVPILSEDANINLASEMETVVRTPNEFIPNILYVDMYEQARVTDTAIEEIQRLVP